jgi:hypothetical protein
VKDVPEWERRIVHVEAPCFRYSTRTFTETAFVPPSSLYWIIPRGAEMPTRRSSTSRPSVE